MLSGGSDNFGPPAMPGPDRLSYQCNQRREPFIA
jgi:hypothetical protein